MGRLQKSYSTCMECGGKMKMKSGGKWIQSAIKNPGSFTKQAQSAGMSVPAFRDKVLANKEDYSSTTVKRANLAKTLSRMRKGQGGMDFKDPMGPDRMMRDSDMTTVEPTMSTSSMEMNPAIEAIDPNLNFARQNIASLEKQAERDNVRSYQRMLNQKYGAGLAEDGAWGPKTQAAYEKFILDKKTAPKMSAKDEAIFGSEKKPVRMEEISITAKPRQKQTTLLPTRPIPQKQPSLSDYLSKPSSQFNSRSYSDNTRVAAPVRNMTTATTRFNQTQIGPAGGAYRSALYDQALKRNKLR